MASSQPVHPTQRFTDRVADYRRYRPGYPQALLEYLRYQCGLSPAETVADIGSGTGQLTRLLLDHGNQVYGVEPNTAMRQAAEQALIAYERFFSQTGRAEATGLPADSVDLVVAGQAFHWFDPQLTRQEFQRILLPSGWAVLVWNNRDLRDPFQQVYDSLLQRYASDYAGIRQRRQVTLDEIETFYAPATVYKTTLPHHQQLDWDGLWGRLMSCSYAPQASHPQHLPLLNHLQQAFTEYQQQGRVDFIYQTQVYCGQLRAV